ncbi:hypothetical protein BKA66DRAFT_568648 [Pyrenochaeta sp. MPI-SDFR-AT-0127]|nr:hypothetical protein BKA66DRAFT_568648 [Pyrenochaeta sp. MPI-SDFR-AT-0127]
MKPQALDAAAAQDAPKNTQPVDNDSANGEQAPTKPSLTPFGERTDGTQSAAKLVEEVVHGVRAAVDGALTWAEKKADGLSLEQGNTGPYASPATCMPSDLDAIASGILPTMSTQAPSKKDKEESRSEQAQK